MKVYSVIGSVQYEGNEFLGVFATFEDAETFIHSYDEAVPKAFEQYGIVESVLGQPVDVDAMADWL